MLYVPLLFEHELQVSRKCWAIH